MSTLESPPLFGSPAREPRPIEVYVVEDDPILLERVLVPRLREFGFQVVGMQTAGALYELLKTGLPDIVVCDVGLPDEDGYSVARFLRAHHPTVGMIILTARREAQDRVRGLSEGADVYLSKPIEVEVLTAALHSLARRLQGTRTTQLPLTPEPTVALRWRLQANGWNLLSPMGHGIALTAGERSILLRLFESGGQVVARERLITDLSENSHDFDPHRLDTLVYRLRRKVSAAGFELPLAAVYGEGYVFNP